MTSRYDYADPGSDPEYCNGLDTRLDYFLRLAENYCAWCGEYPATEDSGYCSTLCAVHAEIDDCER